MVTPPYASNTDGAADLEAGEQGSEAGQQLYWRNRVEIMRCTLSGKYAMPLHSVLKAIMRMDHELVTCSGLFLPFHLSAGCPYTSVSGPR